MTRGKQRDTQKRGFQGTKLKQERKNKATHSRTDTQILDFISSASCNKHTLRESSMH